MWKKLLIISLCVSVLFVFSAPITPVKAKNKSIPIKWQVAGSVANYVSIMTAPPDLNSIIPHYLVSLSAQGSPGPAEITILGSGYPVGATDECEENLIIVGSNEMVARFPDLSLLYATLDTDPENPSSLCMNSDESTFIVNMVITGGTGRFEGAEGKFTSTGFGYNITPDSAGPLGAETGEFIGSIELHD